MSIMMSELSWDEYQRRIRDDAIVLLPVGAVEQHGHHLPLGTDWMMATYMARRAAENVNGIVAAPISYGYRSQVRTGGGAHQCGTTNLDGGTLINLVKDVVKELARHGARKIAVIDGHFENRFYLDEACFLAIRELQWAGIEDARILKMIYAEKISDETMEKVYAGGDYPGLDLEHGGILETAMMLYCYPDLVHLDRVKDEPLPEFPPYDMFPGNPDWVPTSGALSSGKLATAEKGKLLVEEFVATVTESLRREFRNPA
ncbi:creatininase [Microbaculum marinisediminis]|uniref:Creatininase n=1 Tax=Microbaculum marinisediminis TaxID=2931392 RepID=A0AAW5R5U6_9HYPH|nr:creatininase [Microbaculum sp. A6E488]MCT8973895.1 creatininase [Microbaculum sp. A6E488]